MKLKVENSCGILEIDQQKTVKPHIIICRNKMVNEYTCTGPALFSFPLERIYILQ